MSLSTVQQIALDRALNTLTNMQARFHIVLPDGTVYGEPVRKVRPPKGERRPIAGPKNGPYLDGYLRDLKPGGVAVIPPQEGDTLQRLASNTSAWCTRNWGAGGTYTYIADKTRNVVEVLRER